MRTVLVTILFALCGATALAQPPGATPPRAQGPAANPPGQNQNQLRREKIKKRIRALRAYTLTEELSLDEQTAGKLFPLLSRYDDDFDKLLGQRADLMRKLDAAAKGGGDVRTADRSIDDALANQRAFRDLEDRRVTELRKILSAPQVARLLIVLPEFERKIQNQLRNAIQGKPGAAKGVARERDDDDDVEPDERSDGRPARPKPKRQGGGPGNPP